MGKYLLKIILFISLILVGREAFGQTQTISTAGSGTFTVPNGVTSITVEVWGAGGGGGSRDENGASAGGGGGAYSRSVLSVTPGQIINFDIGFGSSTAAPGEDTWFLGNTTLMAKGGNSAGLNGPNGATGGAAASGIGTVKRNGGNGANSGGNGGGGGSSAGILANGSNGSNQNGGTAPAGGGNGGNGSITSSDQGLPGSSPGGGGGGATRQGGNPPFQPGGRGGNGQIRISYIALTSAVGTDNQSVCVSNAVTPITYSVPPGSSVSINNLPAGLTSNYNSPAGTVSISGTPIESRSYTINVTPSYFSGTTQTLISNGSVTAIPNNTFSSSSPDQTICINTALANIIHTTTGATGIANNGVSGANGLPAGVTASWAANSITISGTPTASGTFNYSIPLIGGCGNINATGTITVTPDNTVSAPSSTPILCINTAITNITYTTTGATGIGVAVGLPAGVEANWAGNIITISGTPTASGSFNYTIPLTGGCGAVNATGTITITPDNTASAPSETPTLCVDTPLTDITHTTTAATGIGAVTGLPAGVTANWAGNIITISGTPTASGTFNYTIPLTGGCGSVEATGTISVNANNTVSGPSSMPTLCVDTPLTDIVHSTTGATGISNSGISGANGLPVGLSATWAGDAITISGTPTQSGTFNYSISLNGGCEALFAEGTITVNPASAITSEETDDQRICDGDTFSEISVIATGTGTLSYQWFSNFNPNKIGATPVGTNSPSFTPPADVIGTTYYYVEVTSDCSPIATSKFMQATVEPITTIATQPSDMDEVECFGDGFDPLSVATTGADLTYQWYVKPDNSDISIDPGVAVSGANSSSFTPPSTPVGINYYYVVVTGFCGAVTSELSGEYRVNLPITEIDVHPSTNGESVCQGGSFSELTAFASGEGTVTYQWYSNTSPTNTGGTLIPDATDPNFTPPSSSVGTLYYYATGASNCGTVPTDVSGAFTVTPLSEIFDEQLGGQEICIDNTFTPISIDATGTGTLSYQWYSNTSAVADTLGTEVIEISGATSDSFTPPTTLGTLYYFVKVSSDCGPNDLSNISGEFIVNPLPVPTLASDVDVDPVVCAGTSVTYTTESGQSNYIWDIPGQVENSDYSISAGGIGTSNNTVTLTWLTDGSKDVTVSYTDPNGCTASSLATNSITVDPLPVPTLTSDIDADPVLCEGGTVTYTTEAGQDNYTWDIQGTQGTDYTLTFSGPSLDESNSIQVTWLTNGAKNVLVSYTDPSSGCTAASSTTSSITVDPLPFPTFVSSPGVNTCEEIDAVTYATQVGNINYTWNIPGVAGTDYQITDGGIGTTDSSVSLIWLTTGSKTVEVSYTDGTTGCVASSNASNTTNVEPLAIVGPTSISFPSVCTSDPNLSPFTQPTTGITGIGTPTGLPAGVTAVFNSSTGNIEFSGNVSSVTPGLYSYSIPLIGNCISGLQATGTIDVTPDYELTSVTSASATATGGSAKVTINGNSTTLPNGEYIVTYILDDGTSTPAEYTSDPFSISNGRGTFPSIPLTDLDVEVYKLMVKTIKKVTDSCTITLDIDDPINTTFFSVCGAPFDQTGTFYVPAGIYEITIQASGAGDAAESDLITISVTPGESLGVFVGQSTGTGSGRDSWVTRDSSLPDPESTSLIYASGGGGSTINGEVLISYSCPDPNKDDCMEIVDDGAIIGTTIIRFICHDIWEIPEGLIDFSVYAIGGGGGGGMGQTGGGGGGGGFTTTTINSTNPYGIPAGNSLNIKIGDGGPGASTVNFKGAAGKNTTVTSSIPDPSGIISVNLNALGGGGGGSFYNLNGSDGASGGGGAYGPIPDNIQGLGGSGTPGQGTNGGNGGKGQQESHARAGGGGGGAGEPGEKGDGNGVGTSDPGNGGYGSTFDLSDATYGYGAGGGGIGYNFNGSPNKPGIGGEVNGVILGGTASDNGIGSAGTIFTGSGGGAGTLGGGKGGSGVVYISFFNYRILAVEYLYFEARYNSSNRSAELSWATSQEWENSHFEIERAVNNVRTWTKIGEVKGQGYSDTVVEYKFTDTDLPASGGNIFYRLKQVDLSGDFSYSVTRSIQTNGLKGMSNWIIYPNPSSPGDFVKVDLLNRSNFRDEQILIKISDVKGVFQTYSVSSIEEVSIAVNKYLEQSAPGIHIVQLIWGVQSEQLKILRR